MGLKNSIILISSAVFVVLAIAVFIFYMDTIKPESQKNFFPANTKEETKKESLPRAEEPIEEYRETFIVKDGFALTLPPGWQEAAAPEGFLFMAADFREAVSSEKAREIGFRTNFSIKKDDLTKYPKEYSPKTYAESIKASLMETMPDIEYINEEQTTINNRQAYFIECESAFDEISYKTLLAFIKTDDETMWAISFNTFSGSWQNYRDQFYQISRSFK